MKKMKTVFVIDRTTRPHQITPVVQEQWVVDGEGVATIKFDGTSCMVRDERLFKRFDAKKGRVPPQGFEPCEEHPDPVTGHWPGWLPVGDDPADKWHREAWDACAPLEDGTYELVGPKIQRDRYGEARHRLVRHGAATVEVGRTFEALREWLEAHEEHEGLVFHHPDGRMAKLRRKDFGFE